MRLHTNQFHLSPRLIIAGLTAFVIMRIRRRDPDASPLSKPR
jgi:hypothetical protein